jgi:hypothetical protein
MPEAKPQQKVPETGKVVESQVVESQVLEAWKVFEVGEHLKILVMGQNF